MAYEWDEPGDSYEPTRPDGYGERVKPQAGTYLAEVGEGIDYRFNDKTQKSTLMIPMKILKAMKDERGDGISSGEGAEVADWISPGFEFTMKRLGFIISCSKYRNDFTKKYSGIPVPTETEWPTFLMDLKRYLPNTRIICTLAPTVGTKKEMMNIKSYRRPGAASPAGAGDVPPQSPGW